MEQVALDKDPATSRSISEIQVASPVRGCWREEGPVFQLFGPPSSRCHVRDLFNDQRRDCLARPTGIGWGQPIFRIIRHQIPRRAHVTGGELAPVRHAAL